MQYAYLIIALIIVLVIIFIWMKYKKIEYWRGHRSRGYRPIRRIGGRSYRRGYRRPINWGRSYYGQPIWTNSLLVGYPAYCDFCDVCDTVDPYATTDYCAKCEANCPSVRGLL